MPLFKSNGSKNKASNILPQSESLDNVSVTVSKPSIGSLSIVDKIVNELLDEKNIFIKERDKISSQKDSANKELIDIDSQLEALLKRKDETQKQFDTFAAKEQELLKQIEELDTKISTITEESLKFESNVRSIKGILPNEKQKLEEELKAPKTLTGHTDVVLCLDFDYYYQYKQSQDDNDYYYPNPSLLLFSGGGDQSIIQWNTTKYCPQSTIKSSQGWVTAMQLMRKYTTVSEMLTASEEDPEYQQPSVENSFILFTGGSNGGLEIWNMNNNSNLEEEEILNEQQYDIEEHQGNNNNKNNNNSIMNGHSTIAQPLMKSSLESIAQMKGHSSAVTCLQADKEKLLSGSRDKTIGKWDLNRNDGPALDLVLNGHTSYVSCLQFFQYGLASGSGDALVKMWDLRTGECHRTLKGHEKGITCLQFDEVKVITGSYDKTIKVWDLRTGSCINTLQFDHPINTAKFDHQRLAVAAVDKCVRVYDINTFKEERILTGHTGNVTCLKFIDDSLVSGSTDCTVKMWTLR